MEGLASVTTGRSAQQACWQGDASHNSGRTVEYVLVASGWRVGKKIYLDPFGLEVVSLSCTSVVVKAETGPPGTVPPDSIYPGKVDGVKGPDGEWVKFSGKEDWWSPDNNVEVTKDGEVKCAGGQCKVIPPKKLDDDPDAG